MPAIYQRIRSYSAHIYIATLFFYLLRMFSRYFLPAAEITGYLLGLMAVVFLFLSLPQLKGFIRVLIFFMLGSGTLMFFASGQNLLGYIIIMQEMMNVLIVFMVLELIGFPVAVRDLRPLFRPLLKNTRKPLALFGQLSFISMFLGSVINMAVIPLIYYSLWESLKERGMGYARNLGVSLKRGMAFSLFWSPFGIMMALIVEYSGVPWAHIAPVTFLISLAALLISFVSEYIMARSQPLQVTDLALPGEEEELFWKTFWNLTLYVAALIASVLLLNGYSPFGMIDTLILISVFIPVSWSLATGILPSYLEKASHYFRQKVPHYGEPFTLFIAAGVFAGGLRSFGFERALDAFLQFAFEYLGSIGIVMIIVIIIMLLSWAGLHPVVTLVLISQNLNFHGGVVPPQFYAIGMIIGGSLSNLTSPVAAVTLVSAGLFNRSPLEVGVLWNILFVVMFLCVLPLLLFALV